MVGNPTDKSNDWPNVMREGIEPEPAWRRRDWAKPFPDLPLPGSRTPRLPSWFEDPSQPGLLPPSLRYPSPGDNSPGFPPIPAPVPQPSTIPGSQIRRRIPRPGSRTPRSPSWFEDPSQPGLPPSLQYPSPIPEPVPEPSPIPERQIREWLFDYLLGNNLLDQRQLQQTPQSVLRKDASRNVLDSDVRLAAAQQADQGYPTWASQTGSNEEPSKTQKRFLISRVEER